MGYFEEKLFKWYEWIKPKLRNWYLDYEMDLRYVGTYLVGATCGYLMKKSDELFWKENWWRRAFNRFWECELLKLPPGPTASRVFKVKTSVVVSYPMDTDDGEFIAQKFERPPLYD